MSLAELVDVVSKHTGLPRAQVLATLKTSLNTMTAVLKSGERVVLPGFGTFTHYDIKPRVLFGGGRVAKVRRKLKFRQSRGLR